MAKPLKPTIIEEPSLFFEMDEFQVERGPKIDDVLTRLLNNHQTNKRAYTSIDLFSGIL